MLHLYESLRKAAALCITLLEKYELCTFEMYKISLKKKNRRCQSAHSFLVTTVQISEILTTNPFIKNPGPEQLIKPNRNLGFAVILWNNLGVHLSYFSKLHAGLGSIWIWTGPYSCTGLSDARQVPAWPYPWPAQFQL